VKHQKCFFPFFDLSKRQIVKIVYKGDDGVVVEVQQYRKTFRKWLQMHVVTKTVIVCVE
jgi:hypothetical protein